MLKPVALATCAAFALTGLALAQGTPLAPAQPAPPPPASTQPAPAPATPSTTTTAPAAPRTQTTPAQPGAAPAGQTAQPGLRTVDPTTVRMTFYTVGQADTLASRLIGMDVHNLQNEEVGEIEDLIIDEGKTLRGIVLSVGGFLGIGERRVAVEPASVIITREGTNNLKAVINTTKEELEKAQEFKYEGNLNRR